MLEPNIIILEVKLVLKKVNMQLPFIPKSLIIIFFYLKVFHNSLKNKLCEKRLIPYVVKLSDVITSTNMLGKILLAGYIYMDDRFGLLM